jgi:hypothetical protein
VAAADGTISGGYVQTYAVSESGDLTGPCRQHRPLVRNDSGHDTTEPLRLIAIQELVKIRDVLVTRGNLAHREAQHELRSASPGASRQD